MTKTQEQIASEADHARNSRIGIVIRPDGTVPFDEDVHPISKERILGALAAAGMTVGPHPNIKGAHKIHDWHPDKVKALE